MRRRAFHHGRPARRAARAVLTPAALAACLSPPVRAGPPETTPLPPPSRSSTTSIEAALWNRRSVRRFEEAPLTAFEHGQLLWAAQGITEPTRGLRAAPSAGALYPLEIYLATSRGVVRYLPDGHTVQGHMSRDVRAGLFRAALEQDAVREAPAVFVVAAVFERTARKYGSRARRYGYMEAGHAAQNLLLQAVSLGLAGVPIGAFEDGRVSAILGLPATHHPVYLVPVGRPERPDGAGGEHQPS